MTHTQIIISIIVSAGLLGGLTNFFLLYNLDYKTKECWINFFKSILLSLCASLTVPLFLQIISNNLLDIPKDGAISDKNYFILAGFCVLAAFYSKRFLDDLYSKVNKAEAKAEEAKKSATEAEKFIESKLEEEQNDSEIEPTKANDTKAETIKDKIEKSANIFNTDINTYLKDKADSEMEIILLDLQKSKYRDRSIEGISRSTKIHQNNVTVIIRAFLRVNIVTEVKWYGKIFYRLTPQGKETKLIK